MQLSSAIGVFEFPDGTTLVDAKSIRDTVVGGFLSPPPDKKAIRTPQQMVAYLKTWHHRAKTIPFRFSSSSRFPSFNLVSA